METYRKAVISPAACQAAGQTHLSEDLFTLPHQLITWSLIDRANRLEQGLGDEQDLYGAPYKVGFATETLGS